MSIKLVYNNNIAAIPSVRVEQKVWVEVLSEWYRRQSSHSSTDATDVRPARLRSSGAEPGTAKQGKAELTGAQMKNGLFWCVCTTQSV